MIRCHIDLSSVEFVELEEIQFIHPILNRPILAVRGKDAGMRGAHASFQWTSSVKALVLLLLKFAAGNREFTLVGSSGSAASSLDYAISKQPQWLIEAFGTDSFGVSLLRRIITRTNSNLKRSGPVVVSISKLKWPDICITVSVRGWDIKDPQQIDAIAERLSAQVGTCDKQRSRETKYRFAA